MNNQHNGHRIPTVIIVGGGTAGWMTAAYLTRAFADDVSVVLVESPEIGRVGVGEATFSSIKAFFDFLGLAELDWMPFCDATYKMGIRFEGWNADGRNFYHPFERASSADGIPLAEWWLRNRESLSAYDYSCFVTPTVCDRKRSPRHLDGRVFDERVQHLFDDEADRDPLSVADADGTYPYAYHFDAHKLASFMADYARERGAVRIEDLVVDVSLGSDGSIESLTTADHGQLAADLYIDCTGFRGLLINQALEEPFESFAESLLCDSAIAMRVPHQHRDEINPYTTATALSAGWVWDIPLFSRTGTGYVYSSEFLAPAEAESELRVHLGERASGAECSHIPMRVGRNRNSWVKNCVAIGLSSGFVEPLESTGIFFIQHGIEELINHFPQPDVAAEPARTAYNRAINDCIDGVRDFLHGGGAADLRNASTASAAARW